jgi:hypothetical protein
MTGDLIAVEDRAQRMSTPPMQHGQDPSALLGHTYDDVPTHPHRSTAKGGISCCAGTLTGFRNGWRYAAAGPVLMTAAA